MESDNVEVSSEMDHFQNLSINSNDLRFKCVLKIIHMFHKQDTVSGRLTVLRRLIRGLGATKHELRQGHYANFSCLLKQLPKEDFDFSMIHNIILKTLNPALTSKQETGEAYLGQVLAYSALVHTNHLDDQPEHLETIALALIDLSTKRSYLCAQCFECLCVLISKVPKEFVNEGFLQRLKAINSYTLDKLLYLMYLQNSFPESGTVKEVFGTNKLLSKSNASKLAELIMKSSFNYTSEHKFYESFCTKIAKKIRFTTSFWGAVCNFITEEKKMKEAHPPFAMVEAFLKMCATLLKQVIKQDLDPKYVDILIQDPVVNVILIHGRKHSRMVAGISDSICFLLKKVDDESRMRFLKKIMFPPHGSLSYDKMSGSKMASSVILMMGENSIKELAENLRDVVDTKAVPNKERLIALNLFCALLSHQACYENTQWRLEGLKFLLRSGFFADMNYSAEFAGLIKNAFYSQIANRFPSLAAYTTVLKDLVTFINEGLTKKLLRIKIDPEMANTWKHAMKLEKHMDSHLKNNKDEIIQSIYVLTLYMCLILFKEQEDTKINLQDIGSIFYKLTKDAAQDKEGPAWIEVIMDLFLNLLSKQCFSHRHIIACIFKYLVPHVNDQAFTQLVSVLNSSWAHKVFEDGRQADEVSDTSSEGSAQESEDDDEDDDTEEDVPNQNEFSKETLQEKLRDILGPNGDDMSDVDVENIGEDEGHRIDAALVEAFKSSAKSSFNGLNTRENNTMYFQIKVLDLIETIAKFGMNCSKWLTIIPALINLYKAAVTKNQNALKTKLRGTIHKMVFSKVLARETIEERAEVVTLLQHLLTQASLASGVNSEIRPQLSAFSVFLIKSFENMENEQGQKSNNDIVNLVSKFLDDYFCSSKCHLSLSFFKSLIESVLPGMHKYVKKIAEYSASNEIKCQKRIDALRLLKNYFNNGRYFTNITPEQKINIRKCGNYILKFDDGSSGGLNSNYYIALWNLIMVFLKSKASSCVKWNKWKTQVQNTVFPARRPVIKKKEMKRFKKMCSMLELPEEMFTQELPSQPVAMPTRRSEKKRKSSESVTSDDVTDVKEESVGTSENVQPVEKLGNKRRKIHVNKLKKQSKMLRMEAMNEGLESNIFTNAHLSMDED
ncbi:uncharacterized protein LOC106670452 [Cimex lectularius]|uniref:Myb-binding protein 1A n=1 Tax=Cimex lectularius TaxID=79782 RepID=A0A8I6TJM8_CIMLE|nr:uncharacterized protein LOC106670452 [Cimex lectularius]